MAPIAEIQQPPKESHSHNESKTIMQPSLSQAESVAEQVARGDDATAASTPPATPPRAVSPPPPQRQESALKRLAGRLKLQPFIKQRRSLSAPPALRRRPDHLMDEHFVVAKSTQDNTKVVLPGVPKQDVNWARDLHDFFNLVVLVPVVALNLLNWNWEMLLYKSDTMNNLAEAWTDEWFYTFFHVTALYFITDLLWMLAVPTCVRSPAVIIQHHVATLLYIFVPYKVPETRWVMGACMSVEVNTWLLIARRVFNKQGFHPWTIIDLSFFSIRVKLISIFFYITWVGIRCVLYPFLLGDIWQLYVDQSVKTGSWLNLVIVCFPLHATFVALNLKWSYDLLMSKIRYWNRKGSGNDVAKDKGL